MKTLGSVVLWGLIGAVVGYYVGATIACDWLIPTSNLCGIYGVFLTAPIGMIVGGVYGWSRRRSKRDPAA